MATTFIGQSPLLDMAVAQLEPNSLVLDVGSGNGRNSLYLADLGHQVMALDIAPEYLLDLERQALSLGRIAAQNILPVVGDISEPMFREDMFDIVVANYVLQYVDKPIVHDLQDLTKPGGLNVVEAYIGTPDQQSAKRQWSLYEPGELKALYQQAGWEIRGHSETLRPFSIHTDELSGKITSLVSSSTKLIAKKPGSLTPLHRSSPVVAQKDTSRLAEYWRRADPEWYEHLVQLGEI